MMAIAAITKKRSLSLYMRDKLFLAFKT